jgi:hypothetical protein
VETSDEAANRFVAKKSRSLALPMDSVCDVVGAAPSTSTVEYVTLRMVGYVFKGTREKQEHVCICTWDGDRRDGEVVGAKDRMGNN